MVETKNLVIEKYLKTKQLKHESDGVQLSRAHYQKAMENMDYAQISSEKIPQQPSWIIVSAYYAAYHGALAMLAAKKYSSKSHLATIDTIKELYQLETETIAALERLSKVAIADLELLKEKRETANYSINVKFDKIVADEMRLKARRFLLDVKDLLKF